MDISTSTDVLSNILANQSTIVDLLTEVKGYLSFIVFLALGITVMLVLVYFCKFMSRLIGF